MGHWRATIIEHYYFTTKGILPAWVTASVEDAQVIGAKRWRHVDGRIVTTEQGETYEWSITLDSLLLGVDRQATVHKRDGNPLNFARENLILGSGNDYVGQGDMTYLVLPDAQTALIDTEDVEYTQPHKWAGIKRRGQFIVETNMYEGGTRRRVRLGHFLLGLDDQRNKVLTHLNGDTLDFRKQNLVLGATKRRHEND
jgi:hypothetical protein